MGADQYVLNPDSIAAEAINELTLEPDQSDRADHILIRSVLSA